jgi:hypothetical protein
MRRTPWRLGILLALLAGVGLGLAYAWVLSPKRVTDAQPIALRADFKDQYRSLVAASYAATGDLPRAQARLSLLGDADPIDALNAQAQRMLASSQAFERAEQVAALASVLDSGSAPIPTSTIQLANNAGITLTPTSPPPPPDLPLLLTEMPLAVETELTVLATQPTVIESTPRPTLTFTPTPGEPFALNGQETVCNPNLPQGLLQVLVLNSNRRQLAGVEILLTWEGGNEQFFTGFKPELGNGYADYTMTSNTPYTVQLARGSDAALNITAPTCRDPDGEAFLGGIKLTFQQP